MLFSAGLKTLHGLHPDLTVLGIRWQNMYSTVYQNGFKIPDDRRRIVFCATNEYDGEAYIFRNFWNSASEFKTQIL